LELLSKHKKLLTSNVLRWYGKNGRDLPWRKEHDPYRVLLSEVMLQQTQVSRVLTKYPQFLKRFPSFKRLAEAKTSDVIKAWEGMGYNNRALRLQKLAEVVLDKYQGKLPRDIQQLETLPGIGRYTAHAVACFSFGQRVPIVDTNIRRVLTRVCPPGGRGRSPEEEETWTLAESFLPRRHAHDWNQALMDLGATICTAALPKCDHCPLVSLCPSAHQVRRKKPAVRKSEPGNGGIPNRIFRGRTIQALRKLKSRQTIATSVLAFRIKPDFQSTDRRWFESLLGGLEKDGLIRRVARRRVSLPE